MIYKKFHELSLSCLGMGNMRLPTTGIGEEIDEKKASEIIECAYHNGINYFDTAFRYHDGASELFLGKMLNQFPRDSWFLATKMPGHMMLYENEKFSFTSRLAHRGNLSPKQIFEEQLKRCQVDYFDFYLLHNVCELSYDFYTNEEINIVPFLLEQKKAGRIRNLGFSSHGRVECIEKFITWSEKNFGPCFNFIQIQLNYLDWKLQEANKKYDVITKHGIPIMVMEPCRGGSLSSLDERSEAVLKKTRPNDSIASWAFRFLQSLPNVQVVLSGMTKIEQLQDNLKTFSKNDPITDEEKIVLEQVIEPLLDLVPCTACRYCCEVCTKKLNIPKLISMFNEAKRNEEHTWRELGFALYAMKEDELPRSCVGCGACKKICPQGIDIPEIMKRFKEIIEQHSK